MKEEAILGQLEALAYSLGVDVRYEHMAEDTPFSRGGLCRIRGKKVIIVNAKVSTGEQVRTLVRALKRFDLGSVYLRPAIRELLEGEKK